MPAEAVAMDATNDEELSATQGVADVPLLRRSPGDALADFYNMRPAPPDLQPS